MRTWKHIAQGFGVLWLGLASGCVSIAPSEEGGEAGLAPQWSDVRRLTEGSQASIATFGSTGPFEWMRYNDVPVSVTPDTLVEVDIFRPIVDQMTPIVLISHGFGSSKESHEIQAERLASWGLHVLTVSLPSRGPWVQNGETLAALSRFVAGYPALVGPAADGNHQVIVGHSFGGSAALVAAAEGAPIDGIVLLDPAIVSDRLVRVLRQVRVPVLLLGADKSVFRALRRDWIHELLDAPYREISVRGATHNDAQFPSDNTRLWGAFDFVTSEDRQEAFTRALTASCLSLVVTGTTDWAWQGLTAPQNAPVYFGALEKFPSANR
jgi:pimeloyl-ACP methyl ester carboxylesterase